MGRPLKCRNEVIAMNIFRRPDYRSEATQFIDQLKTDKPELDAQQLQGRSLLWDKSINHDDLKDMREGQVAQKPYVYQTNHS
jgi:hypothetical protein